MDATTTWTATPVPRIRAEHHPARRAHRLVLDRAAAVALAGAVLLAVISGVLGGNPVAPADPLPAPTPHAGWAAADPLIAVASAALERDA